MNKNMYNVYHSQIPKNNNNVENNNNKNINYNKNKECKYIKNNNNKD